MMLGFVASLGTSYVFSLQARVAIVRPIPKYIRNDRCIIGILGFRDCFEICQFSSTNSGFLVLGTGASVLVLQSSNNFMSSFVFFGFLSARSFRSPISFFRL